MHELMRAARLRRLRRQRLAPGELHRHLRHRVRRRDPDDRRSGRGSCEPGDAGPSTSGSVSPRRRPEHPRRAADAPADRQPRRDRHPHRARRRRARDSAPSRCSRRTTPRRCTLAAPTTRVALRGQRAGRLSRRGGADRRRARGRLRRDPSRATASSARTPPSRAAAPRRACASSGRAPEVLELFGDKARARALAERCGVPVLRGHRRAVDAADDGARVPGVARRRRRRDRLKAVAGGGGRGMRVVRHADELDEAYARCRSEARAGLRQRRCLRRAAAAARAPHRGADRRRRPAR